MHRRPAVGKHLVQTLTSGNSWACRSRPVSSTAHCATRTFPQPSVYVLPQLCAQVPRARRFPLSFRGPGFLCSCCLCDLMGTPVCGLQLLCPALGQLLTLGRRSGGFCGSLMTVCVVLGPSLGRKKAKISWREKLNRIHGLQPIFVSNAQSTRGMHPHVACVSGHSPTHL